MKLKMKSSPLIVKKLVEEFKLSLLDSKFILHHINVVYGHCNRCKHQGLKEEYINCPKCKALNFNWKVD